MKIPLALCLNKVSNQVNNVIKNSEQRSKYVYLRCVNTKRRRRRHWNLRVAKCRVSTLSGVRGARAQYNKLTGPRQRRYGLLLEIYMTRVLGATGVWLSCVYMCITRVVLGNSCSTNDQTQYTCIKNIRVYNICTYVLCYTARDNDGD